MSSPSIQVENVCKTFQLGDNLVEALANVSLDIDESGITALMGPSGSGKSSLLNLIGALDRPTSGQVTVCGQRVSDLNSAGRAAFRNSVCGFIFQNFNLIPVLTTLENVLLPSQLGRKDNIEATRARALELLNAVGLDSQAHQPTNKLSGGQMQRVAIARALINRPKIVLADEPTANLDQETSTAILELLNRLCESEETLVLMATHDQNVVPYCRRVIYLKDGAVVDLASYNAS